MELKTIVFYLFSAILLFAALRVITARNPVHSVLFLVLAFFTAAGLWLLLQAEFLAITLVLVYVGAVMVLFLFVVMMLDINIDKLREGFLRYLPLGLMVGIGIIAEMVLIIWTGRFELANKAVSHGADYSNTKELGRLIYTDYVYPFEIAAVILLVAIIVAIALTMRQRKDTKYQNPASQVAIRRKDRIRIVSMPSEKSGGEK